MNRRPPFAIALFVFFLPAISLADQKLVIHEWGTFTSLQSETGEAVGHLNSDDEPLPTFTHNAAMRILSNHGSKTAPRIGDELLSWQHNGKGLPFPHPDVTMRLETPVVYFHPAVDQSNLTLDLSVDFHGGWLTQFYPNADVKGASQSGQISIGPLTSKTIGGLTWSGLYVGGNDEGPPTTARVWTAPRAVQAASVATSKGEAEKFLFYRGVGHINAPLRVSRDASGEGLDIRGQLDSAVKGEFKIKRLWLVDIRFQGGLAYRSVGPIQLTSDTKKPLAQVSASFAEPEFTEGNLQKLRAELHQALADDGLFGDEAEALLNTWEESYFKSPGLRLFFLVPQVWTDHYLPLRVSVPATITRSMVGRIELVTPEQRRLLRELAEVYNKVPPGNYPHRAYLVACKPIGERLGRFRNALVMDEQRTRGHPGLKSYIECARHEADRLLQGSLSAR